MLAIACAALGICTVIAWIGSSVLPRGARLPVGIIACVFGLLFLATLGWILLAVTVGTWR